jgi:predicted ATPase
LTSFRPEFFPHWLEASHVTMLRLNRLAREHTEALILNVAGRKTLPIELYDQITNKSDGVPLFAEELTKAVLESGLLQNRGNHYVPVRPIPPLAVPATLRGSLTARLDRLGPAKEVAQVGATIGREFSHRLLAAVAPISGPALEDALSQLVALELVFVRGETSDPIYTIKHALVQDAAYDTIVKSKRQQLHGRIADTLIDQFPDTVEAQPELIAHHLTRAGLAERAIGYLRKAGQHAIERSANAEAIGHLTHALGLLESYSDSPERNHTALGLEVMLAQAMTATFGYAAPRTRDVLLRAKQRIDETTDLSLKFAILYGVWASHYVAGEGATHKCAALQFVAEAERYNDTAAMCMAHRALGTSYLTLGELAAALIHLQRACSLYDAEHHAAYRFQYGQDIGVAALCYLAWTLWQLGSLDQASAIAAKAIRDARDLAHPHTLVYAVCHVQGFMDLFRRSTDELQSYASHTVSMCRENGFSHWLNCARILEGWGEINSGNFDKGLQTFRLGVAGWQGQGARLWLPFFLMLEAEASSRIDHRAALTAIEEALTVCKETGEYWPAAELLRVKAGLLRASKDVDLQEIEAILVQSLEIARKQEARCWELRTACDLVRLWQRRGRATDGLKLLQPIYDQFTEGFETPDLQAAKTLIRKLKMCRTRR